MKNIFIILLTLTVLVLGLMLLNKNRKPLEKRWHDKYESYSEHKQGKSKVVANTNQISNERLEHFNYYKKGLAGKSFIQIRETNNHRNHIIVYIIFPEKLIKMKGVHSNIIKFKLSTIIKYDSKNKPFRLLKTEPLVCSYGVISPMLIKALKLQELSGDYTCNFPSSGQSWYDIDCYFDGKINSAYLHYLEQNNNTEVQLFKNLIDRLNSYEYHSLDEEPIFIDFPKRKTNSFLPP